MSSEGMVESDTNLHADNQRMTSTPAHSAKDFSALALSPATLANLQQLAWFQSLNPGGVKAQQAGCT